MPLRAGNVCGFLENMRFEEALKAGGLKRLERELDKQEVFENQLKLLSDDLEDANYLLERRKFRGAYTHLFNALERLFDSFFTFDGLKVKFRAGREAAVIRFFGERLLSEFRDFYASRRGGMYEEFAEITKGSLCELAEFFGRVLSLVREKSGRYSKVEEQFSDLREKL